MKLLAPMCILLARLEDILAKKKVQDVGCTGRYHSAHQWYTV